MPKVMVTEDRYIDELNRLLRGHELYLDKMAFLPYPAGATGHAITGYSVAGPLSLTGVYAQVAQQAEEQFSLDVGHQ